MARLSDLLGLIIQKTNDRKIPWSSDDDGITVWSKLGKNVLELTREEDFMENTEYQLKLRNSNGEIVEYIHASGSLSDFGALSSLHDEARRQALKIDVVIDELQGILNKL